MKYLYGSYLSVFILNIEVAINGDFQMNLFFGLVRIESYAAHFYL